MVESYGHVGQCPDDWLCSSMDRAPVYETGGRRFDPCLSRFCRSSFYVDRSVSLPCRPDHLQKVLPLFTSSLTRPTVPGDANARHTNAVAMSTRWDSLLPEAAGLLWPPSRQRMPITPCASPRLRLDPADQRY